MDFFKAKKVTHWRVARHGSLQLNKDTIQIRVTEQATHLPVFVHFCESHIAERSARSKAAKGYRRKRGGERRRGRRRKDKHVRLEISKCDGCCDAGSTHGPGLLDPPWPCSFALLAAPICVSRVRSARCPRVRIFPRVTNAWQGSTRWKQGWSGSWKGWDDSSVTVSPVQNSEQISDESITTALHTLQDHLQQTTVISQRRFQKVR